MSINLEMYEKICSYKKETDLYILIWNDLRHVVKFLEKKNI